MAQEAAKAVKRQVREVSVPALDVYTLSVATSYAITNSQGVVGGTALAASTAYQLILAENAALTEAEVPEDGRVLFMTPATLNLLKRDPEFVRDCDKTYADLQKGIIGEVDGLKIVVLPSTYYVTKFQFMIIWDQLLIRASKFNSVRVLTDVQGIDGSVAEGREYGDVFIPAQKATAVRVYTKA